MTLDIQYLKKAEKFFTKNNSTLSKEKSNELIAKAVQKLIKNDVSFRGNSYN